MEIGRTTVRNSGNGKKNTLPVKVKMPLFSLMIPAGYIRNGLVTGIVDGATIFFNDSDTLR
jgi:hypothetical protein